MPSGSPRHISVTRTHSKRTFEPAGFPKTNEASLVFVDRNSSRGGVVVGNLVVVLGVAMGAGLAQGSTTTSEPTFGEDQLLCLGRIVVQVLVS